MQALARLHAEPHLQRAHADGLVADVAPRVVAAVERAEGRERVDGRGVDRAVQLRPLRRARLRRGELPRALVDGDLLCVRAELFLQTPAVPPSLSSAVDPDAVPAPAPDAEPVEPPASDEAAEAAEPPAVEAEGGEGAPAAAPTANDALTECVPSP